MFKKIKFVVIGLTLLSLLTTACQYSMSQAPEGTDPLATPSVVDDFTEPMSETMDPMAALEQQATQTALAQGEVPATEAPVEETADPGETEAPADAEPTTETPSADLPTLTPTPIPTTDTPAVSSPQPGTVPATYTLKKGEFPYCIARRYNLNPTELLSLNGLSDAEARALAVGLVLKLPQTGNPFPGTRALTPHPAGTTYTVQTDDTIYSMLW